MAILLHNLRARKPTMNDVAAVADVLNACEIIEDRLCGYMKDDVLADWQRQGFVLDSDAWIITTKQAQVVGYADVWMPEPARIEMRVRVHPEHRRRGIGTLLLRLAEDQARRLIKRSGINEPVTLYSAINDTNKAGKYLLEQEGFVLAQYCWQIGIEAGESAIPGDAGQPTLEVHASTPILAGIATSCPRTGLYTARCYAVYEKELWQGDILYAAARVRTAA